MRKCLILLIQNWQPKLCEINYTHLLLKYIPLSQSLNLRILVMASNRYCIDLAKRGVAGCKECKVKIDKGLPRIAKILPNPFTDSGGELKQWFHVKCIFEKLSRARATTKKIDSTDDLEGWDELADEYKPEVIKYINEFSTGTSKKTTPKKASVKSKNEKEEMTSSVSDEEKPSESADDSFRKFRKICTKLSTHSKYTEKTAILAEFFKKGSDGSFKGNLYLWVKMLLPAVEKRVYNLQTTQLLKIFSKIFEVELEEMQQDLEESEKAGDVSETIKVFFEKSNSLLPAEESTLFMHEVDGYLEKLSKTGLEVEQTNILKKMAKKCTASDLKYIIRLIKHDLRINAGPKPVLEAIHPDAYEAFQASRDLKDIVKRSQKSGKNGNLKEKLTVKTSLMTPVLPMLAMACKDLQTPFKKYPNGFYVEVKYDGERIQIHKKGNEFSYFSRSLKPVMPHKVSYLKEYIPQAFPHGDDLMLDGEILLVDKNDQILPFGTLGAHKQTAFKDANVCLFVFDCLQYNDENLMNKPLVERRKILEKKMTQIKQRILVSELIEVQSHKKLNAIMASVFDQGLEGVLIKSKDSIYEPGKRHWLKLKKDYLKDKEGKGMADSADLIVLGGYYGTGRKGGIMSVFLMGCKNELSGKFCTVTKVPGGDDATLEKLQKSLKMIKINKDPLQVPSWLNINKALIPDFIVKDPDESPVWEISGAEFSKAEIHTAGGISIRFPRVTRVRFDRSSENATTVQELKDLYEASKLKSEVIGLKTANDKSDEDSKDGVLNKSASSTSSVEKGESSIKSKRTSKEPPKRTSKESPKPPVKKVKLEKPQTKAVHEDNKNSSELSNIFSGVKLNIPASVPNAELLRRHFVAYDGELLKDHQISEASHAIVDSSDSSAYTKIEPKEAKKITVDWLWDSIKLQKKQSTKLYEPQ